MNMRRLRVSEICILFFFIAVYAFSREKEQRFSYETRKIAEFLNDEFYESNDFVDLGNKRNKLKEKFDENLKEQLSDAEYERQLLQFLKNEEAKEAIAEFESSLQSDELAYQLPNIVITGAKKCGTKALQRFFGHHPQVIRGFAESPFQNLDDSDLAFRNYLKSLYRIWTMPESKKKIEKNRNDSKASFFMAKTGMSGIVWLQSYLESHPEILNKHENLQNWMNNVQCITILCDPVHRLFSDFKHMKDDKAGHLGHLNKKTLGSNSAMMPLADLTFDDFVGTYLPLLTENDSSEKFKIPREMTTVMANGAFGFLYKYYASTFSDPKLFKNSGLILDGNSLKTKPWEVMMKLEKFLKLEKFFDAEKFVKREDGYYCVRDETAENEMDCMPSSKGRTSIRPETQKMLRDFYEEKHIFTIII
ncbi:unnamed protein product [Oikopleura dioica]|uniref:Sulfotransferase n=1 Tax=Oikopleura dioica TaxID=34765 RepID=E4WTQ4_OIKDI|nr:unnamed protein product [Oikopleura dioica]